LTEARTPPRSALCPGPAEMSPAGTSSGSPAEGTDLLPPLVPGPVTLFPPWPCLWGALGLERGCISLSLASPKDRRILPGDSVCREEAAPCPSARPRVGLRATGVDHSPLAPFVPAPMWLQLSQQPSRCLPGQISVPVTSPEASGGVMGSARSLGATDGTPRHGGPELVLSMNSPRQECMGTIICFTLAPLWFPLDFYFCLNRPDGILHLSPALS